MQTYFRVGCFLHVHTPNSTDTTFMYIATHDYIIVFSCHYIYYYVVCVCIKKTFFVLACNHCNYNSSCNVTKVVIRWYISAGPVP